MPQLSGRRHSKASSSHVEEDDDPFETPYEVPNTENNNNHHSPSKSSTHHAKTNTTKKSSEKLEKSRSSEAKSRRSSESTASSSRKHSHDSTSHNTPVRQKSHETSQNAHKRSEKHEKRDKSTEKSSSSIQRTNSARKSGSVQNGNSLRENLQRTPSSNENHKNSGQNPRQNPSQNPSQNASQNPSQNPSQNSNDSPTTPPPVKKSSFATAFEEAINSQTGSTNSRKVNSVTRNLPKGAVIKDKTPKVVKRPPKSPENQSYGQSAPKMAKTLSFDEAPPTSKRRPSGSSFIHDMPASKSPGSVRKESSSVVRSSPQVVQRSFSNSKAASIADKRHNTRKNVREALYDRLKKDDNTDRDTELSKKKREIIKREEIEFSCEFRVIVDFRSFCLLKNWF